MAFKLTDKQKVELKLLTAFPKERFDELVELLQHHMREASVKKRGEQTTPIIVEREKFKNVIKHTETLKATLDSLSPNDYDRLKDNVSFGYSAKNIPTGQVFRRSDIDISGLLTLIEESADGFIKDSKDAYGSRHADKSIGYILDFWRDNIRKSIRPISNDGEFVWFAAIVLDKNDDAMRNLINEYIKRWPDQLVREELAK